jgi:hypothetical protein
MEKYTGKIFVVLKNDKDMAKVIEDVGDNLLVRFGKTFCSFCYDSSSLWEFYRAPEPSDINWQNMGIGAGRRCCQTGFVWFITSIILGICIAIIQTIKTKEDEIKNEYEEAVLKGKKMTDSEKQYVQGVSAASSISIWVLNASLKFVVRRLTMEEKHSSITRLNISVGLKLTLARFINSSLLLLIINFSNTT